MYYCTEDNCVVCASQPGLLLEWSEPRLGTTQDPEVRDFYANHMKSVRNGCLWVGDGTYFGGIKHLLPNHCLDVTGLSVERYWPNRAWKTLDLEETVSRACGLLQGMLKGAAHRHPIMMAVTAGTDSRTLLAASRSLKDQVYYFINKERDLTRRSRDIRIPASIFDRIGVPFHIHDVGNDVDPEFRRVFSGNTFFASDRILPTIYNVYYKTHQQKLNVVGVGEIGRGYYGPEPKDVTAYYLAYSLRYKRSKYATRECERWLNEVSQVAQMHGINVMTLFLWEQLLGNWGAVGNSESDIAIEEFDPYDSHSMYETLLAIDEQSIRGDRHLVFQEMIRKMWPELLDYSFNPPDSCPDAMRHLLKAIRIYPVLRRLRFRWNRLRYQGIA